MDNKTDNAKNEDIRKLGELIEGIDVAMMTTVDHDGSLHSRPMATQQMEFDGDLWFFTDDTTLKVREVERDHKVNLSYADAGSNRFVSVSGNAELVKDRAKMEELWSPMVKAWFPKGIEDPNIVLMKVSVVRAEYWDAPSSKLVALAGFVKSLATGERYNGGENETIDFSSAQ
jgi:general stress protein 26